MTKIKPFFIKTITPLHVGSGSDLGIVDLPIQREAHTGFPKIEASSLKGAIRKAFEDNYKNDEDKKKIHIVFGCDGCEKDFPEDFKDDEKDFAGALGFSDARILFFPVKSVKGVFAYITCPMVLKRLQEDLTLCENTTFETIDISSNIDDNECIVFENNQNIINDKNIILEEYSFEVTKGKLTSSFKIPQIDKTRLVIISDDNFTYFVKNSTEVITRTKINNQTGTVKQGGLFTEEYLPAETVMYSLVIANKPYSNKINNFKDANQVMEFFNQIPKHIQIGGNSTLGKGIVEIVCEGCKNASK